MSTYFVRMTPLEPYTFGGEKGFRFGSKDAENGRNNTVNTSYYQTSKEIPEQTTIIGMLRHLILRQAGVAKEFSEYTKEDREKIGDLIGNKSFSFQETEFHMGKLQSVSPVFVVDQEKEFEKMSYFVRNPLNNLGNENYYPMKMQEKKIRTSNGLIQLPVVDEKVGYTTKSWLNYGYLNIGSKEQPKAEFVGDMFVSDLLTGNKKNEKNSDEDGFFKRQVVRFKRDNYAFAVFVECEEGILPQRMLANMGLKKSLFLVECTSVEKNDLEERIQRAVKGTDEWYYALSDVLLDKEHAETFSIIFKKQIRNMETILEEKHFQKAVKRAKKQYNLIEAGSVFYKENPIQSQNENLRKAGYNCIVKIGGAK